MIGIVIIYFIQRIFKESTEPNLPYVVQKCKSGSTTTTTATATTPSNEKKTS
jgi:hypothetical protein